MKLLIVLLAMAPALAFGQGKVKNQPRPYEDGYIIYGDGRKSEAGLVQVPEKKRGLVKFNFRKSSTGIIREIRVEQAEVLGFRSQHTVYLAIDYSHDSIPGRFFVKVLVDGNLSLFDDNGTMILKPERGNPIEMTTANYREVLQAESTSCPAASQMAQNLRFDPEVLTDFIKGYNKCLTKDPNTFDPFADHKVVYLGVSSGIEFSSLEVDKATYPAFSATDQKHFFAGLLVYVPYSKSQALEFGVVYKQREFKERIDPGVAFSTTFDLNVSYNEFNFPVTFRQALWRKNKTACHASAGVSFPILISQSSEVTTRVGYNPPLTRTVSLNRNVQYNFGIGVEIVLENRQRLLIHNVFFLAPATLKSSNREAGSTVSGYSLFIGYAPW